MSITIQQAFIEAAQAEKTAEKFYRRLERKFSADPEVASFWNQFAKEEARHASLFSFAIMNYVQEEVQAVSKC